MQNIIGFILSAAALLAFGRGYSSVLDKRLECYSALRSLALHIRDKMHVFSQTLEQMLKDFSGKNDTEQRLREAVVSGCGIDECLIRCDAPDKDALACFLQGFGTDALIYERQRCDELFSFFDKRYSEVAENVGQSHRLTRVLVLCAISGLLLLAI